MKHYTYFRGDMKHFAILCLLFVMLIIMGCSTNADSVDITEEKAVKMMKEEHARNEGPVEVISVLDRDGKYLIHWEVDPIMHGMDSVDQKSGK